MDLNIEVSLVRLADSSFATPLRAVLVLEGDLELTGPDRGLDGDLGGLIANLVARGDFKGREGATLLLFPPEPTVGAERVLLVGLGKKAKLDAERFRRAAATAVKQAIKLGVDRASIGLPGVESIAGKVDSVGAARAIAEGAQLGAYTFDQFKTRDADDTVSRKLGRVEVLLREGEGTDAIEAAVRLGSVLGRAANTARDLGNLPGNVATPSYLATRARQIGERHGMTVSILGPDELLAEGMESILAVSRGSEEPPFLIVLEHRRGPAGAKPLCLVGKGLTFDSGGISIKPALGMEEMKFDMCGGAAVLAAMDAIGELEIPIDVVGIVPTSENLLSGKSMKPGDIIRTHLGKTVEVVNTDAEGRLILADALSYARRFDPAAIVDTATLTGACVIALGTFASALFGNDEGLSAELRAAGDRVYQRVWPMPMFEDYRDQIKSDYADIKNAGGRPAGSITAALFLREFVADTPWVHLDIAGTAYGDGKLSYQCKGSTGVPTRLLVDWVISRAG